MQLKERYGDDKQRLNQEMMKLYQTEKVNPLGGCLPILDPDSGLHRPLLGAARCGRNARCAVDRLDTDLASPDPYFIPAVIMMVSMFIQTKLNPTPRIRSRPRS